MSRAQLVAALVAVVDSYDDTGCEYCGVITADVYAQVVAALNEVES